MWSQRLSSRENSVEMDGDENVRKQRCDICHPVWIPVWLPVWLPVWVGPGWRDGTDIHKLELRSAKTALDDES